MFELSVVLFIVVYAVFVLYQRHNKFKALDNHLALRSALKKVQEHSGTFEE